MIPLDLNKINQLFPAAYNLYMSSVLKGYSSLIRFFDNEKLYIVITPEFYENGINWCIQVLWYLDKKDWPEISQKDLDKRDVHHYIIDGTMSYGDNNEFPTREHAEQAAFFLAFELLDRRINGKKIVPDIMGITLNNDIFYFNELI